MKNETCIRRSSTRRKSRSVTHERTIKELQFLDFTNGDTLTFETKGHCQVMVVNNGRGCLEVTMIPVKEFHSRIDNAHRALLQKLFGYIPINIQDEYVDRGRYSKFMKEVMAQYNIEEGDPDFSEWTMLLIMRSPRFYEEGDDNNDNERA